MVVFIPTLKWIEFVGSVSIVVGDARVIWVHQGHDEVQS